jgi:hypothetical protein
VRNRRAAGDRRGRDVGGWLGAPFALAARFGWAPRDALAFMVGVAGAVAVVVNALFLQSGPHPAPLLKTSLLPLPGPEATNSVAVAVPRPRAPEATPAKAEPPRSATAATSSARSDGIADLLSTRRVAALQKALAQYGYGQIKPTGAVDAETRAAIERFERERKLPVTGQPSERLVRELTALTGRPLD